MQELTGLERIRRTLNREPIDRIGFGESFWGETITRWRKEGHLGEKEMVTPHFGFDLNGCWCLNNVADLDFKPQIIEEDDETKLVRDGNGALLR